MKLKPINIFILSLLIAFLPCSPIWGQVKVVTSKNGSHTLYRNGKPYYIKGVGGEGNYDLLVRIGGNSIRTWGTEHAREILDEAQKKGLTVMLGLWLQTERQGFDYDNSEKVANQLHYFQTIIDKYKDHPALLFWGIGNELDLQYKNIKCWNAVQDIAAYIHKTDPNHPTSTVTAGLDSTEVRLIKRMAPDIDIYGINTYGEIGYISAAIKKYGWEKPYIITEWGTNGYWESANTTWSVAIEPTSSEKTIKFYERYTKYIEPDSANCLGSYAFYWGNKQEYTESWFGLFSKDNMPTEPIDALESAFLKKNPANPAPTIIKLTLNSQANFESIRLKPGKTYEANVIAGIGNGMGKSFPDSAGALKYQWKVLKESNDKRSGGDTEAEAALVTGALKHSRKPSVSLITPSESGAYRLFLTVEYNDKQANANIPFYVEQGSASDISPRLFEFRKTDMNSFRQP